MTAPPWGHKPPPVDDVETYWTGPPPSLSPRVQYWLRRLGEGTWYIWEYWHVVTPALAGRDEVAA